MSRQILRPNVYKRLLPKPYIRMQTPCKFQSNRSTERLPLLKQPVPDLDHTMNLYLQSVKPFLNEKEYSNTIALANDFRSGVGKKLQDILLKRAQTEENWVADWWQDEAYLEDRRPIVINTSPGLILPVLKVTKRYEQLKFAARVLMASWKYKELVDSHGVFQEIAFKSGLPLDMSSYNKIFGTCRLPCRNKDVLSYNTTSSHFIVIHNGHLFHLDILGGDNILLSEKQVIAQLKYIVNTSECTCYKPIGILTSENRDTWAQAYQLLLQDRTNAALLTDVQDSIAVLCLDKCCGYYEALKDDDWRRTLGAHQVLHGGGTMSNSINRWFDKSMQYIVGHDGFTALLFEHSPADGQAVAGFAGYLLKYMYELALIPSSLTEKYKNHTEMMTVSKDPKTPWYMNFHISPVVENMIHEAKTNLEKLHKRPAAQYEAASVRTFAKGRTETIRTCSVQSVQFAKAMLDKTLTCEDKVVALKKAIAAHRKYALQAAKGLGVDRHLFGLRRAAILTGLEVHPLFTDVGFERSFPTTLSTSRVFLKYGGYVVFGPTAPDGYALCYSPRDKDIVFSICAFKGADTNVDAYRYALEQSLQDMLYILDHV